MNRKTFLFLTIAIGIVAVATVSVTISRQTTNTVQAQGDTTAQQSSVGAVDGAVRPDLIPDYVAYSLLFRMIAGRNTEAERNRVRSYIRQMKLESADVDALILATEDFNRQVRTLDGQAATIRDRHVVVDAQGKSRPHGTVPTRDERAQLNQLQRQKEQMVTEIASSLQSRLSPDGFARVRQYVNERMKHRIRITAA